MKRNNRSRTSTRSRLYSKNVTKVNRLASLKNFVSKRKYFSMHAFINICFVSAFTNDFIWQSILHGKDYNYPQRRWQVGLLVSSLYQLRDQGCTDSDYTFIHGYT